MWPAWRESSMRFFSGSISSGKTVPSLFLHKQLDVTYIAHLRTYWPLFRQLPSFQFIYIAMAAGLQNEAAELFSLLVEAKGLSDLTRYFDVQTKWDSRKYPLLRDEDLIFLNEAKKHYRGGFFNPLFRP